MDWVVVLRRSISAWLCLGRHDYLPSSGTGMECEKPPRSCQRGLRGWERDVRRTARTALSTICFFPEYSATGAAASRSGRVSGAGHDPSTEAATAHRTSCSSLWATALGPCAGGELGHTRLARRGARRRDCSRPLVGRVPWGVPLREALSTGSEGSERLQRHPDDGQDYGRGEWWRARPGVRYPPRRRLLRPRSAPRGGHLLGRRRALGWSRTSRSARSSCSLHHCNLRCAHFSEHNEQGGVRGRPG